VYSYNRWYITIIDQKYTSTLVLRYFFENILLGKYILVDTKNLNPLQRYENKKRNFAGGTKRAVTYD
jgi:hypothetical protein